MSKHRRKDGSNDGSDDNSYSSNSEDDEDSRRRRHDKKKSKSKKSHKHSKKHKKHKKHRKRDRRDRDYDSDSDSTRSRSHKRRKKEKKENKRKRKEEAAASSSSDTRAISSSKATTAAPTREDLLAQALCLLFSQRPVLASELPIMLIRLAGGSTFDLRQMNDHVAAKGLELVFESLAEFGVTQNNDSKLWMFQAPAGRRDERVLLRVIRALLDDVGVTMDGIQAYETKRDEEPPPEDERPSETKPAAQQSPPAKDANPQDTHIIERIKEMTSNMIFEFQKQDASLGQQLAGLCQTIAQGESISIDGLPDAKLKEALEAVFVQCGLEKSEMEDSDDEEDDDDDDEGPLMGYGLPENHNERAQIHLASVMESCRNPTKRVLGPQRPTQTDVAVTYSDEDDEGPTLPGQETRPRGPKMSAELIKAQAEHRALELKATAAGIEIPIDGGGREEWMLIPGKFDFMANIKSGQPMKSRGFENKKARGGEKPQAPIHPAIQAEMDAILEAHEQARGPSLIEQHRAQKQQEKQEAAAGNQGEFKWSRDNDLDAGRRVDKDALHSVLGGAAENLKNKFQGGF